MAGGGSAGERTEKATPKRRKKARHDGQIGNSPEVGSWLGLLAASFVIPHVFSNLMDLSANTVVQLSALIQHPDVGPAMDIAVNAAKAAFGDVLPMALLIALVGVLSVGAQGGIWVAVKLLKPNLKRLNPLSGFKRMFGPHALWSLVKALLKTAALALVTVLSVRHLVPTVMGSGTLDIGSLVSITVHTVLNLIRAAAAAGLAMAFVDYAVVRRRNNKSLKMTMHEVKEEFKSTEGDPRRRGLIRSRQLAMSRNRMMADVAKADVVVVNPTHIAVALRYEPDRGAPRVVAKGGDHLAARIRAVAEENRVPMVSDIPLARTLYQVCDIGQEIPADLFKAVATVLAFIMTLRKRGSVAGTHRVQTLLPARG